MISKLNSQVGIALVTTLLLTMIAIAIATATIYMVTQSTEVSGIKKRYTTALGASKGGAEATALIVSSNGAVPFDLNALITIQDQNCLNLKLFNRRTEWGICNTGERVSNTSYDIRFDFDNYQAYSKIVDTIPGNTLIGESLEVKGVVSGQSGFIKNPTVIPHIYRIEIRSENSDNPQESADITALYAH